MKPVISFMLLLGACLLIGGCNTTLSRNKEAAGLAKTAAEYYNFKVGNLSGREYSSFLSPAYRNSFAKEDLELLNKGNSPSSRGNDRIEKITAEQVLVSHEANFAMTDAAPGSGFAFESMEPQRWVKSGSRWYLYLGSDREVADYGYFPVSIPFPSKPEQQPAQVIEEKRRKDQPVGNQETGETGGG